LLGAGLTTVAVKTGLGQFSARQFPAQRAREMIEEGAKKALGDLKAVPPYDPSPCTIEVEFTRTASLDEYTRKPGVVLTGERTVTSTADTWWEAWQQFFLR
jgi:D-amino peptidase